MWLYEYFYICIVLVAQNNTSRKIALSGILYILYSLAIVYISERTHKSYKIHPKLKKFSTERQSQYRS
jgi:hypothetical protein